jgi:hypothetical protein
MKSDTIKTSVLAIACFLTFLVAEGQETNQPTRYISIVPQYLFNSGLRIDYDYKLSENKWLQFCPQIYLGESGTGISNHGYDELLGAGMMIYYKRFLNETDLNKGIYLSYGPSYNYFHITFQQETQQGGSSYSTAQIHKIGGDIILGLQSCIRDIVMIDVYAGLGLRYCFSHFTDYGTNQFNDLWIGYGYSGTMLNGGIRIGIKL